MKKEVGTITNNTGVVTLDKVKDLVRIYTEYLPYILEELRVYLGAKESAKVVYEEAFPLANEGRMETVILSDIIVDIPNSLDLSLTKEEGHPYFEVNLPIQYGRNSLMEFAKSLSGADYVMDFINLVGKRDVKGGYRTVVAVVDGFRLNKALVASLNSKESFSELVKRYFEVGFLGLSVADEDYTASISYDSVSETVVYKGAYKTVQVTLGELYDYCKYNCDNESVFVRDVITDCLFNKVGG